MKLVGKLSGRRPALAPDPEIIRQLAGLLAETGLTEIEYAVGDHRIRVAREPAGKPLPATNGHAAPVQTTEAAMPPETPLKNGVDHPGMLNSPIVGIAYLAPQPGAPPFVKVGDEVSKGQTVLIIEAMKVMNQIGAPRAGRISQIFAVDADPVEYGAPLMLIE